MIEFIRDCRKHGIRIALCVYPFHRWPDWPWFLVASPLLRFAMGPRPGEKWWQGWFIWPLRYMSGRYK